MFFLKETSGRNRYSQQTKIMLLLILNISFFVFFPKYTFSLAETYLITRQVKVKIMEKYFDRVIFKGILRTLAEKKHISSITFLRSFVISIF